MESSHKERLKYFQQTLSTEEDTEDTDERWSHIIDTKTFQEACLYGIPDEVGVRSTAWKVLLGYLPPDKALWSSVLADQRLCYYVIKDLLEDPGEEPPSKDHPLNVDPSSKWASHFNDNRFLDQIDKDIRRTLPDLAFFQLHVPQHPQNPLSPPPRPEKEESFQSSEDTIDNPLERPSTAHRFSFSLMGRPRSSSAASKKSSKNPIESNRARSNSKSSLRSFSSVNFDLSSDKLSSPRSMVRKLSSAFKSTPAQPKQKKPEPAFKPTLCPPILNRRTLFQRIAHMNRETGPYSTTDSIDPIVSAEAIYTPDYHWEAIERLLFIYAKLNPGVGYVQGMNELLAPIYYVFAKDPHLETQAHAEADAFFVFTILMSDVRDHFVRSLDQDASTGINATMMRMSLRFKWVDQALWRDLHKKEIKEQYYAFRWITVLCSQEWDLPDVIRLWDSLLADRREEDSAQASRFEFLLDFTVAMLTCVRQELLQGDFGENVRLLQNYPLHDIQTVLSTAYSIRDMRLQAIQNGQIVPGVNDRRISGMFSSDWSDTSSISSTGSAHRLQRLRDSTGLARASFDSFRRDSKESIDELFKRGLAMTREGQSEFWKRASSGEVTRSFSQRLSMNGLASKVRRNGSMNMTRSATYGSEEATHSVRAGPLESSGILEKKGLQRLSWMRPSERSVASGGESPATPPTRSSSLLHRFSHIMGQGQEVGQSHHNEKTSLPLASTSHATRKEEEERHVFEKAVSVRDELLGRTGIPSYRGVV
ncbi:rab-GTPase-TBC domain-containing protein [Spinellus fusiger]|nr:rab-GTPase-TBC domain-containing protein [Spinellus fusiger]